MANNVTISLSENIFVPQHAHVVIVAFAVDFASLNSVLYSAVFFVVVQAVVEPTLLHAFTDLNKVVSDFCRLEIDVDEFADAGSVNEVSAETQLVHFRKSGGVFTF